MKMTKIESARIIAESTDNPVCRSILCSKCFNSRKGKTCKDGNLVAIEKAKAYIKRHEQKTKKKDHILDTTKKVTRPNFRKYLREKIDMKVRVTPELSEELQKIAFEESVCWYTRATVLSNITQPYLFFMNYEICYSIAWTDDSMHFQGDHRKEYNPKTDTLVEKVEEPKPIKTVGIDNLDVTLALTAQHEHVKDCPVNSEYPQPIKLPDFVYSASKNGVGFIDTKNRTFNTNDKGELLINDKPCFATPEEALQVAKKLWGSK